MSQVFLTIMKEMRDILKIDAGDRIDYEYRGEHVIVRKVEDGGFKVSQKFQVTVPAKVFETLGIRSKGGIGLRISNDGKEVFIVRDHLQSIKEMLGEDLFSDPECHGIQLNDTRVFKNVLDKDKHESRSHLYNQITPEERNNVIRLIESLDGNHRQKNTVSLQVVLDEYFFMILYPPTATVYQVTIHKLGPNYMPFPQLADLWRKKRPFILTRRGLYYYEEKGRTVEDESVQFSRSEMHNVYRAFLRNAVSMEDFNGYHPERRVYCSTTILTLSDGDGIVVYFDDGPIDIRYLVHHRY